MMASLAPDRFETVAWVYSPSDLALLLSRFGQAGIPLQRVNPGHAAADPALTTALGGIALRVHVDDAGEARALLAELEPIPYRARLAVGLLLIFLVLAFFGIGGPPRQVPTFVTGDAAVRREG
jgi:hypothetical protein